MSNCNNVKEIYCTLHEIRRIRTITKFVELTHLIYILFEYFYCKIIKVFG